MIIDNIDLQNILDAFEDCCVNIPENQKDLSDVTYAELRVKAIAFKPTYDKLRAFSHWMDKHKAQHIDMQPVELQYKPINKDEKDK